MERITYKLDEEKKLKVVVRGASKLLSTEEIEEDLKRQNISFSRVARQESVQPKQLTRTPSICRAKTKID